MLLYALLQMRHAAASHTPQASFTPAPLMPADRIVLVQMPIFDASMLITAYCYAPLMPPLLPQRRYARDAQTDVYAASDAAARSAEECAVLARTAHDRQARHGERDAQAVYARYVTPPLVTFFAAVAAHLPMPPFRRLLIRLPFRCCLFAQRCHALMIIVCRL